MTDKTEKRSNPGPGTYTPKEIQPKKGILIGTARRGGEPGPVTVPSTIDRKLESKRMAMTAEFEKENISLGAQK